MYNPEKNPPPFDFIQRHYRDPGGDDPIERWLPHPENARGICAALDAYGIPRTEIQDAMQEVFLKVLDAFRDKKTPIPIPADLRAMKAYCATAAKNYAIDTLRTAAGPAEVFVDNCEAPDEFTPLEYGAERRDPVDAGRQLEVLAQLFRKPRRMPEHGIDILEGVASGCTQQEIAEDLAITERAVEGRMRTMRRAFRKEMARLGLLPSMQSLVVIVSMPRAIEALRRAA